MQRVLYLSHPQVRVEPAVPVPRWGLSDLGRARMAAVARRPWLRRVERIVSSEEAKAVEAAGIVADALELAVEVGADLHENDRSATGFLPPDTFEPVADAFFARPDESVRGWERAADAQARIVGAVRRVLAGDARTTLFVGHGGVGTLLRCAVAGLAIGREHDQGRCGADPGGGNVHAFLREPFSTGPGVALYGWTPMEEL